MDLAACAAAYSISGGLVSQTYAPTSSPVPSSTSSPAPTSYSAPANSTTSYVVTSASSVATVIPSQGYPTLNSTSATFVAPTGPSAPAPAATEKVEEGAGSVLAPASALFIVAAGFAALL